MRGRSGAFGDSASVAENAGFEVVFVLDPTAGYRTLMASGWTKGMMPTTTSTTKQFDSLVQQGSKGSEAMPKNSWKRSESSLIDAEKMWFVLSNENLQRANGFSQGKMNWLLLMFNYGSAKIEGKPRIADAVAASGLVAAAGPRRRAVVVILGNHPESDGSGFTAEQAQNYLAEVGVPLFVLRNGKLRDDGWPEGVPVRTMEAAADALEAVKADISTSVRGLVSRESAAESDRRRSRQVSRSLVAPGGSSRTSGRPGAGPRWNRLQERLRAAAIPRGVRHAGGRIAGRSDRGDHPVFRPRCRGPAGRRSRGI